MANDENSFELSESGSVRGTRYAPSRRIPKSWIIIAVLFYCASVTTVGLLAGFLPRRTRHITILATPTPTPTSTSITTTEDPSICIDDECNPRLLSDLIIENYELEYMYNNSEQTILQGQVIINFQLKQPIKQLIYHSKRMSKLENPALYEDGVYRLISMRQYLPNDYISLRLLNNNSFAPNKYKLVQKFLVDVADGNVGFYQNIFKDGNQITQ